MKQKNITNITFASSSIILGSTGIQLILEKDYIPGIALVVFSLGVQVLRELLKKDGLNL